MTKKIKDYLAFYIGQEFMADNNKNILKGVSILAEGTTAYNGEWNHDFSIPVGWWVENCDFKLILRPLSDLKEEEMEYLWHKTTTRKLKHEGSSMIRKVDLTTDAVIYLLSKGFDLFGLIDAGLAIPKQT